MANYIESNGIYTGRNIVKLIIIGLMSVIMFLCIPSTEALADIYIIEIGGQEFYMRDGEFISELEYWEERIATGRYYGVGLATVLSDGTSLWYGNNKAFFDEDEALAAYLEGTEYCGAYAKSDGTFVWYYDGVILASKQEYIDKYAADNSNELWTKITTLPDDTTLYCYNGKAYTGEREFYEAQGYYYAADEREAKTFLDVWFGTGCSDDKFKLVYSGTGDLKSYYEAKRAGIDDDYVFNSFRQYVLRTNLDITVFNENKTLIQAEVWSYIGGTKEEMEASRKVAKEVADTLRSKNTYDQIKGAYEWLCKNIQYDHSLNNHSIYSALIGRKTVCEGYAMAFQLIMEELGIESYIVMSTDHTWNAVRYDGKLYWADATWGDQVSFIDYGWLLAGTKSRKNNTCLNISSSAYSKGGSSTEQTTTKKSTKEITTTKKNTIETTTTKKPSTETTTAEKTTENKTTTEEMTTVEKTTNETIVEDTTVEETTTEDVTTVEETTSVEELSGEVTTEIEVTETVTTEIETTMGELTEVNEGNNHEINARIVIMAAVICVVICVGAGIVIYSVKKNKK